MVYYPSRVPGGRHAPITSCGFKLLPLVPFHQCCVVSIIRLCIPLLYVMPSIHIPEAVFREYVSRTGDYDAAKEEIKQTLRTEVDVES